MWVVNIMPQLPCPRACHDALKKEKKNFGPILPSPYPNYYTNIQNVKNIILLWNSFNQMSSNSEILTIRHLRVIPRLEVLLLTSQKLCQWHWQISGTHSKIPPRLTDYIDHCGIFWSLVSYLISFFRYEDCKNTVDYPDGPEPAVGDFQMEYSSD